MSSFIKNQKLLRETPYVEDCLAYHSERKNLSKKLESIPPSSTVGLVGAFGRGKSTLLHNIKQQRLNQNKSERWVEFEAWQFPNRKDLWEGFTLEVTKQIEPKLFESIKKKIDGESKKAQQQLLNVAAEGIGTLLLPGSSTLLKKFSYFLQTSPARRVFEIQNILMDVLDKNPGDLYIITEDVDRSGDYGMNFLETLKQFLKSTPLKNRVICIAPIATKNFMGDNHEAYLKCLDFIEFFDPKKPPLESFLKEVIRDDFTNSSIGIKQIEEFFYLLFEHEEELTMRKLKLILRKADINYKNQIADGYPSDWRITILFEAAKYIKRRSQNPETKGTYFSHFKESLHVNGNSPFYLLMQAVLYESLINNLGNDQSTSKPRFAIINEIRNLPQVATVWESRRVLEGNEKFFCSDFYLSY